MTRPTMYMVADVTNPTAEPFMVVSVDMATAGNGRAEGTVVSLHWSRDEAQRIMDTFNEEPCEYCKPGMISGMSAYACENCMNTGLKYPPHSNGDHRA